MSILNRKWHDIFGTSRRWFVNNVLYSYLHRFVLLKEIDQSK